MRSRRILLLLFITMIPGFGFRPYKVYPIKWVLNKECSLKVNGSTNINKFSCTIPDHTKADTLTFYKENNNETIKITGSMLLEVNSFNCHNPVMTGDLRKTLKAKEFPKITISFINLSKYPDYHNLKEAVKGLVSIQLAGVTKRFDVDYRFIQEREGTLTLIGTKQLNFSDFNITPPRKLGGMIKTNNKLDVEFTLNVKILE